MTDKLKIIKITAWKIQIFHAVIFMFTPEIMSIENLPSNQDKLLLLVVKLRNDSILYSLYKVN